MELNRKNITKLLLVVTAVILIYQVSDNLSSIWKFIGQCLQLLFPFILGFGLAFIFNVPMRFYERQMVRICREGSFLYKKRRVISFLLMLFTMLGILLLVALLVIPQLTVTISQVVEQVPKFNKSMAQWFRTLHTKIPQLKNAIGNLEQGWDVLGKALQKVDGGQLAGMFSSTVGIISGVVNGVVTFFIAFVFACYVLFQKETLSQQCKKGLFAFFSEKTADRLIQMARMADETFSNFLVGQCTEAVILGLMFVVVMSILGLPYSVMIGVLIAVMSLIPIVGAFIGCFVGAFLILMVDPMQAVVFVAVFLILQQIEGNLIYPHVVGNSVGLPSLWVLFAVTIGGNLMGVAGMIIGIPVVSMLYTMLSRFVNVRLVSKKISPHKWQNQPDKPSRGGSKKTERQKKKQRSADKKQKRE